MMLVYRLDNSGGGRVNLLRPASRAGLLISEISTNMQRVGMAGKFAIAVHWSYRGSHD